jgi:hypothetical protein
MFAESTDLLPALLRTPDPAGSLLFIDLATVPDAARVIGFVKASSTINKIPIVTLGTAEDYDSFDPHSLGHVNGVVEFPCQTTDIATVVETLTQASPPAPQVIPGELPPK